MNTFKKKAAICESAAGSVIKPLELNQNQGTVTIDYRAYYHMHHDSLMLHLLLSCNDEKVRYQMLDDFLKERAFLGHGYKAAQCPVTDADAICFVYGINSGTVDRMLSLCDVYLEGAIAEQFHRKTEDSGKVEIPIPLARRLYAESQEFNDIFSVAQETQSRGIPMLILTNDPTEKEREWQNTLTEAHNKSSCLTIDRVATNAFLELKKFIQEETEEILC